MKKTATKAKPSAKAKDLKPKKDAKGGYKLADVLVSSVRGK